MRRLLALILATATAPTFPMQSSDAPPDPSDMYNHMFPAADANVFSSAYRDEGYIAPPKQPALAANAHPGTLVCGSDRNELCPGTDLARGSDVIVLADFMAQRRSFELALVLFYAPWCEHCRHLQPEFEAAATQLLANDPPVHLIAVDAVEEALAANKFEIEGYPTLKVFRWGEKREDYDGPRDAAGIVRYMQARAGEPSRLFEDSDAFDTWLDAQTDTVVVGVLLHGDEGAWKQWWDTSERFRHDYKFAHCMGEVGLPRRTLATVLRAPAPSRKSDHGESEGEEADRNKHVARLQAPLWSTAYVVLPPRYRPSSDPGRGLAPVKLTRFMFNPNPGVASTLDFGTLKKFVADHGLPLIGEMTQRNAGRYLNSRQPGTLKAFVRRLEWSGDAEQSTGPYAPQDAADPTIATTDAADTAVAAAAETEVLREARRATRALADLLAPVAALHNERFAFALRPAGSAGAGQTYEDAVAAAEKSVRTAGGAAAREAAGAVDMQRFGYGFGLSRAGEGFLRAITVEWGSDKYTLDTASPEFAALAAAVEPEQRARPANATALLGPWLDAIAARSAEPFIYSQPAPYGVDEPGAKEAWAARRAEQGATCVSDSSDSASRDGASDEADNNSDDDEDKESCALIEQWAASRGNRTVEAAGPGAVVELVGSTFSEVLNDVSKDVIVQLYAPWCVHCKRLAPLWRALAKKFEPVESVVVAQLDATANDLPPKYDCRGYPTIYFAPASGYQWNKDKPKMYDSDLTLDAFAHFIKADAGIKFELEGVKGIHD